MPEFDVEPEEINLFELGDIYAFTHYFDNPEAFKELEPWYNNEEYRFEIPKDDLEKVESILKNYLYEPVKIHDLQNYTVSIPRGDDYSEILRNSVHNWEQSNRRHFIMKDELSVKQALEKGADQPESPDQTGTQVEGNHE